MPRNQNPHESLFKSKGQNHRVLKQASAEAALWQVMARWSAFTDKVISFGNELGIPGPIAWRTDINSIWQPVQTTTIARIIWNYTFNVGSPSHWVELQNADHEVLHIDLDRANVFINGQAEFSLRTLGQDKKRMSGTWLNSNIGEPNRLLLRIPHK
jgi:hypothetical protein